jgi:hypothetical protein
LSTVFAIHQPNYIPWLGYFYKIQFSDIFVFLDVVQVPRGQSLANRNKILGPQGAFYLTVPLNRKAFPEGKFTYRQALMASSDWKKDHLKSIYLTYKKSLFFDEVYPFFENILLKDSTFCDMNILFIQGVCDKLKITSSKFVRLSEILTHIREKNDLIIDISEALNAKVYLCGRGGGLEYTNPELLKNRAGIEVIYSNYIPAPYLQFNSNEFVSHLSVLDYLFNVGFKNPFTVSHPPEA